MEEKELITKEQMIELFKETLAVDRVEEEDDFFVKGGNSINASLLLYKIFCFYKCLFVSYGCDRTSYAIKISCFS